MRTLFSQSLPGLIKPHVLVIIITPGPLNRTLNKYIAHARGFGRVKYPYSETITKRASRLTVVKGDGGDRNDVGIQLAQ